MTKDLALLSLCLMGTNAIDLYNATKYDGRIFAYERTKTKDARDDHAHIEIAPIVINRPNHKIGKSVIKNTPSGGYKGCSAV